MKRKKSVREQKASDDIKGYFNGLWGKLKDRSQAELADTIIDLAKKYSKQYLPTAISFIIHWSVLEHPVLQPLVRSRD
jgi:hypothetical protein